jgi:Protein of unknown function (DUF3024)
MDELAVAKVKRFCDERVPPHALHQVRLEFGVRGNSITIFERRAPWAGWLRPEWSRMKMAQFRFDPSDARWRLYWSDRNERWHELWDVEPSPSIHPLLQEVAQDPTAVFWG